MPALETIATRRPVREFEFSREHFSRICGLIRNHAGINLSEKKREMVYSRLSRRLRALGLNSFSQYLELLSEGAGEEWANFVGALTTHLTSFFREGHHFGMLAACLPEWSAGGSGVRLWSCAASTGEEPYSMAITAAEAYGTLRPPVSILATDVDLRSLETARSGIYPLDRVKGLPDHILRRYFLRGGGSNAGLVRIRPELLPMVTFRHLNLLDPAWPLKERFEAIFCRNVMIYFDRPTQRQVLARCRAMLKDEGLFFAGHSEHLGHAADLFSPCGRTVYRPAS